MRQLGQKTAFVIEQIEKNGPALITRYGHFVAMITPLGGQVESRVLSEMAREIGQQRSAASPQAPALQLLRHCVSRRNNPDCPIPACPHLA